MYSEYEIIILMGGVNKCIYIMFWLMLINVFFFLKYEFISVNNFVFGKRRRYINIFKVF